MALSAVGLAALIALPGIDPLGGGQGPTEDEVVPGADTLHVVVDSRAEEPLRPGDRVRYTLRMRNSGYDDLPEAQVVQFLPPTMGLVSGPDGAEVEGGRMTWPQPLGPGERAVVRITAEVTGVPEGSDQAVGTVCLRPEPEATIASCASSVHSVRGTVPVVWVAGGVLFLVLLVVGAGLVHHRRARGDHSEAGAGSDAGAEAEPGPRAESGNEGSDDRDQEAGGSPERGHAAVYQLDFRR
jgi:uncharacterized repeat protein (TIGR01451 family)